MSARMPSSSSSSRRNASGGVSPASILPPGNSHLRARAWCSVRWQHRISSPSRIKAATTCLVKMSPSISQVRPDQKLSRGCLQIIANQSGAMLDQLAVIVGEGCRQMAVDVELSDDLPVRKDRSDDL